MIEMARKDSIIDKFKMDVEGPLISSRCLDVSEENHDRRWLTGQCGTEMRAPRRSIQVLGRKVNEHKPSPSSWLTYPTTVI